MNLFEFWFFPFFPVNWSIEWISKKVKINWWKFIKNKNLEIKRENRIVLVAVGHFHIIRESSSISRSINISEIIFFSRFTPSPIDFLNFIRLVISSYDFVLFFLRALTNQRWIIIINNEMPSLIIFIPQSMRKGSIRWQDFVYFWIETKIQWNPRTCILRIRFILFPNFFSI